MRKKKKQDFLFFWELRRLNLSRHNHWREMRRERKMGGDQIASLNSALILRSSWTTHVQNSLRIALLRTNDTSWIWRQCIRSWDFCSSAVEKKKFSECQKTKRTSQNGTRGHYSSSTSHHSRCFMDIDTSYLHPLTQSLWNHIKNQSQITTIGPKTLDAEDICMHQGS